MNNDLTLATLVDTLGALKAQIADLTAQEKAIKASLKDTGKPEIDGEQFRATITTTDKRSTSAEALAKLLAERGVDPALIAECAIAASTYTEVTTVRVVARKRS